jgi:hypothetical protein
MRYFAIAVLLAGAASAYAATVYTNEADFLAAIAGGGGYMLEDFNGYTYGSFTGYTLQLGPQNGYAGLLKAEGGANSFLWSGYGDMSTNSALDYLRTDFNGNPTYSVGGYFYPTDISGYFVVGMGVVIDLSDGTHYTFTPQSKTEFRGFVSSVPLTWMKNDAPDSTSYYWPTMDHYYIDSPEPASLGLLALGALALLRRR